MKYTKLTPNLVVRDVQAAIHFYTSVLGFKQGMTVRTEKQITRERPEDAERSRRGAEGKLAELGLTYE